MAKDSISSCTWTAFRFPVCLLFPIYRGCFVLAALSSRSFVKSGSKYTQRGRVSLSRISNSNPMPIMRSGSGVRGARLGNNSTVLQMKLFRGIITAGLRWVEFTRGMVRAPQHRYCETNLSNCKPKYAKRRCWTIRFTANWLNCPTLSDMETTLLE